MPHIDKHATDQNAAKHFYLHIQAGEQFMDGILPDVMRQPSVSLHSMPYFMAAGADGAMAKELEATVVPPMLVDKTLRIAVLADPLGAAFALFQS